MMHFNRRSGRFQSRTGCSSTSRRPRRDDISHRRAATVWPSLVELENGSALIFIKLQLAQALRQFLQASDYLEACRVAVRNPILLLESAPELLRATVEEAEQRGNKTDKEMLLSYLKVLELARETSGDTDRDTYQ